MNIILKSFDGNVFERMQIEHALRGMHFGTCIAVTNGEMWMPEVTAATRLWVDARKQRVGEYNWLDWNTIRPLDAKLIEQMRDCEAVVLKMIGRYIPSMPQYALMADIPFLERRRMYYEHLRYWNHMIEEHRIDLLVMNHEPHQAYDFVLYELCRLKGIPSLYISRTYTIGECFLTRDWKDASPEVNEAYKRLQAQYANFDESVALSDRYEKIFRFYRDPRPAPVFLPKLDLLQKRDAFSAVWRRAMKVLFTQPRRFFASVLSREFWARKKRERQTIHLCESLAREPDLSVPYIYVPLHLQPEASTLPFSGPYEDQQLVVEMLAACIPEGWKLYIKENPEQDERWRSEEFYRGLAAIPSVSIVPKKTSTYELLDHAQAVATGTGTVAFEAMLRCKPTLMFGYFVWQYGPGVLPVRTVEDCRKALEAIEQGKAVHTERDARLFLKALEETAIPYPGSRRSPVHTPEEETEERETEKARIVGDAIKEAISAL